MYLYFQAPSPYHGFPVVALTLYFPDLAFSYLFHGTGPKLHFAASGSYYSIIHYVLVLYSASSAIVKEQLQCNNYNVIITITCFQNKKNE